MPNAMPSPIFIGPHGSPLCFAIFAGFFDSMMYSTCLLKVMVVWVGAFGSDHPRRKYLAVAKQSSQNEEAKTKSGLVASNLTRA